MKKLLTIVIAIFLIMGLAMSNILPTTVAFGDDLGSLLEFERQRRENTIPLLRMTSNSNIALDAGASETLELVIKNIGGYTAKNIVIQAVSDDNTVPFVFEFLDNLNMFTSLNPNVDKTIPFLIKVDDNITESKTYTVSFKYTYFNDFKKEFEGEDKIYIKIQAKTVEQASPKLSLVNFISTPSIIAENSRGTITATLQNTGSAYATDIQVTLDGLSSDAISVSNGTNIKIFNKLGSREKDEITFDIAAAEKMNNGNYPVTFKITYKDADKNDYSTEQQYFINIAGNDVPEKNKAHVRLSNIVAPSATYIVGSDFKISMDIANTGENEAKNVKITAKPADPVVVSKSASVQMIDSLAIKETKNIEFLFAGTANAVSQNYVIEFIVEYEDGTKDANDEVNKVTFSQFSGVNISNPKKDKEEEEKEKEKEEEEDTSIKDVPKIIIQKYECNPIIVNAGAEFDLTMVYENTHNTKTVRNIKVLLTVNDTEEKTNASIFTPVKSSNTFYIDSIPPKGTVERSIRLYAIPNAQPITYSINVNFEYEDNDFNEYKAVEYVGINVKQDAKLDMSAITLPPETSAGQPVSVFFEFYNVGKVTLSNLTVELEGDFNAESKKTFYGNLDSGSSEYYENFFVPLQPGDLTGNVKISYEDPSGEYFERTEEFTINVTEEFMPDEMMDMEAMKMGMPEESGGFFKSKLFLFISIGVLLLIGGIVLFFVIRRIKKNKRMALNE